MVWFWLATLVAFSFSFVVFFGAPYLPTLTPQVRTALKLAGLKPGDHLLELGSGDGKVLVAAAQQGIRATGYELNPLLWFFSWLRTRRYRKLISVRLGNFWRVELPQADVVFVFLLPKYMKRLDTKIERSGLTKRLVSFAFEVPGKPAQQTENGVFLYQYV